MAQMNVWVVEIFKPHKPERSKFYVYDLEEQANAIMEDARKKGYAAEAWDLMEKQEAK